jgi:hypothetical protein
VNSCLDKKLFLIIECLPLSDMCGVRYSLDSAPKNAVMSVPVSDGPMFRGWKEFMGRIRPKWTFSPER